MSFIKKKILTHSQFTSAQKNSVKSLNKKCHWRPCCHGNQKEAVNITILHVTDHVVEPNQSPPAPWLPWQLEDTRRRPQPEPSFLKMREKLINDKVMIIKITKIKTLAKDFHWLIRRWFRWVTDWLWKRYIDIYMYMLLHCFNFGLGLFVSWPCVIYSI